MTQPYEKLGAFYLGREYDIENGGLLDDLVLYDAKDLTTHAVCVGMTGSGKTGLCLSVLEEAAIDKIPAIAIDPKGDLGNLMLTFPELRPEDFRTWIDEGEASRKGMSPDEYAKHMAELWSNGLASWGQDGERIARLLAAADVCIYTPGSNAGLPLNVLRSFKAPPQAIVEDSDALRERVLATVSGLLALLDIKADPIRSREHILLSNILDRSWRDGRSLDLAGLIGAIQKPPFERIGVLDIDSFFPAKERFELAMTLNNLLASPGFASWMEGEPLDIPRLLHTPDGKPRISILSIAHLCESERMFFVTLVLNEMVAWMRTQPGSTSLRALLCMDEVFGYFPPTANPPSKTPMLTLLKQARAFGLGVLLATQNPVDLDYRGLANAGTWFLGRLQTERDKARVLDGLEGASVASGQEFDRKRVEAILSGLGSRLFLMSNVHEDEPSIFHTRWAMSYLRGPLTRPQIKTLMDPRRASATPTTLPAQPVQVADSKPCDATERPLVPPGITERFIPVIPTVSDDRDLIYRPALLGRARIHFANARQKVDVWEERALLAPLATDEIPADPWEEATDLGASAPELSVDPEDDARFATLNSKAVRPKAHAKWSKALASHLYRTRTLTVWRCKEFKAVSEPGESKGDFCVRLSQMAREKRDLAIEKLRKRYASKFERLRERIRKADAKIEREKSQHKQQKVQTAISIGATVLGALLGRKAISTGTVGRATTSMRGMGRAAREKGQIAAATEDRKALEQKLTKLEAEFSEETATLQEGFDVEDLGLETREIRPRKSDTSVGSLVLAWIPWQLRPDGIAEPVHIELGE